MNPNETTMSPWLPAVLLLLLVSVVICFLYLTTPLQSARPYPASAPTPPLVRTDTVQARLWQDPLQAVQDHLATPTTFAPSTTSMAAIPTLDSVARRLLREDTLDPDATELRLAVFLPGGPYAYDRETRRRQRHAVVSALTQHDYIPQDQDSLRHFATSPFHSLAPEPSTQPTNLIHVAYERYLPGIEPASPTHWGSVTVLWLNSQDFHEYPLQHTAALLVALDQYRTKRPRNILLGPVNSDGLMTMTTRARHRPASVNNFLRQTVNAPDNAYHASPNPSSTALALQEQVYTYQSAFHIMSPRATVPLDWLFCVPQYPVGFYSQGVDGRTDDPNARSHACVPRQEYRVQDSDPSRIRTVQQRVSQDLNVASFASLLARDDLVLGLVLQELRDRRVCDRTGTLTIAVLTEQDTIYGRLLDDIIEVVARRVFPADCVLKFHRFAYLRGLDGEMQPGPAPIPSTGQLPLLQPRTALLDGVLRLWNDRQEPSFGPAQLDYVRRLSVQVQNAILVDSPKPLAVGVFGSDVYDKLLLLQSLREPLASATFFSTDLDATLTQPRFYRSARNLLVGSAHGLSNQPLGETEQSYRKRYMSRDVYQLALFRAVVVALTSQARNGPTLSSVHPQPRLFELGRTRAWQLTAVQREHSAAPPPDGIVGVAQPITPFAVASLSVPLLLLTTFAFFRSRNLDAQARFRSAWNRNVFILGVASTIILLYAIWRFGLAEPGSYFEGVNVVPTLTMQFTTLIFALAVIAWAHGRTADAHNHARLQLVGTPRPAEWKAFLDEIRRLRDAFRSRRIRPQRVFIGGWIRRIYARSNGSSATALDFWNDYRRSSRWWRRAVRVVLHTTIVFYTMYFLLGVAVLQEQPLLSRLPDDWNFLALASGVAVLLATFYCRDTLRLWQAFIRALAHLHITRWRDGSSPQVNGHYSESQATAGRLSMRLLVECTRLIEPLVVLPFLLGVLLFMGRTTVFDNWNWTTELIIFHFLLVAYALFAAVRFQVVALQARQGLIDRLRDAARQADTEPQRKEIDNVVDEIRGLREGAFVPWSQHPVFQSLLVPACGFALVLLLEAWLLP